MVLGWFASKAFGRMGLCRRFVVKRRQEAQLESKSYGYEVCSAVPVTVDMLLMMCMRVRESTECPFEGPWAIIEAFNS